MYGSVFSLNTFLALYRTAFIRLIYFKKFRDAMTDNYLFIAIDGDWQVCALESILMFV